MKDKLRQLIKEGSEYWSIDELREILDDIETGGDDIRDVVEEVIEEIEAEETYVCAVCGDNVRDDTYVLLFGPQSFRKQANFCAVDCLEYFLGKLKSLHNKKEFVTGKQEKGFLE